MDPPVYLGCAYGKVHRKPMQRKGEKNKKQLTTTAEPGQVVNVDQLINPTPGFIPTHRGIPRTQRYIGATVFVDHLSNFTYIQSMEKLDEESTVQE